MNARFQIILAIGLIGITAYDIVMAGFDYKHAIFIGIASTAIYFGLNKK